MKAPYRKFGETRDIEVKVYVGGQFAPDETAWDFEAWMERSEDWYAFENPSWKNSRVRVVERKDWLRAK